MRMAYPFARQGASKSEARFYRARTIRANGDGSRKLSPNLFQARSRRINGLGSRKLANGLSAKGRLALMSSLREISLHKTRRTS
jgi:hypothetical protein